MIEWAFYLANEKSTPAKVAGIIKIKANKICDGIEKYREKYPEDTIDPKDYEKILSQKTFSFF